MLSDINKTDCCGCGACAQACPKGCIVMAPDEEGFLYPRVDHESCINCGLCRRTCPVLSPVDKIDFNGITYIVQHKDDTVRRESTSGGAFTAIAEQVIRQGGSVWGVVTDKSFKVRHSRVDTESGLSCFRGSKYCQSETDGIFTEIRRELEQGNHALFSGTPCQVEGLLSFLGKEYDNLITTDVVCRGVPSPLVFEKYIAYQRQKSGTFDRVVFRDKYNGYSHTTMSLYRDGECLYHNGLEYDPMLKLFFKSLISRPSCGKCAFKKAERVSDFTLWDCFNVGDLEKNFDDNKGTSNLMINTKKGLAFFEKIKAGVRYASTDAKTVCDSAVEMTKSCPENPSRDEFFKDLNQLPPTELFEKWCPVTASVRIEKFSRNMLARLGLYSTAAKLKNLLKH